MVLIHRSKAVKKVPVRGKIGGGVMDTALMTLISTGLPWEKILASIGAATYAGLGAFGAKKLVDKITEKKDEPPPLLSAPIPQGTLKGDMVSPKDSAVTRIDPKNHYVDLPGDYVVTTDGIKKMKISNKPKQPRKAGGMLRQHKLNSLLDNKSREILTNLKTGRGIFTI